MNADLQHLIDRLTDPEAGAVPWLWQPLLALLAQGSPVTVQDLSAATGRSIPDVRLGLAAMSDTEYDSHGRILGHGLTPVPTPHRFELARQRFYTWCALDHPDLPHHPRSARPGAVPLPHHRSTGAPERGRHWRHRARASCRRGLPSRPCRPDLDPVRVLQRGPLLRLTGSRAALPTGASRRGSSAGRPGPPARPSPGTEPARRPRAEGLLLTGVALCLNPAERVTDRHRPTDEETPARPILDDGSGYHHRVQLPGHHRDGRSQH